MKILIYGAGVIGGLAALKPELLAAELIRAMEE